MNNLIFFRTPFNYIQNLRRKFTRVINFGLESVKSYKKRSVVFLYNSYYHFYYLAKALRKRGWDAVSVSYEDPINGPNVNYYHGEDINLFSPDPIKFRKDIEKFYKMALYRFSLLHFAGDGLLSFFPENWYKDDPEDIIYWRSMGKKVAYTVSGCNSCISQSSFAEWSKLDAKKPACDSCRWQFEPDVCSDEKNLKWGIKVKKYCDLICAETLPALDYLRSEKTVFNPLTMCLDPDLWKPDLEIPERFRIHRSVNEFFVYHAVGNYKTRTREDGSNIKGTPAIMSAVKRLQNEGLNIRLIFATDMKNYEVRYIQAQADVIIDQLILGLYGATAREGMMLGKPVICYLNLKGNEDKKYDMQWKGEVPLVSATEETIYFVLKDLLQHPEKRYNIGQASRKYAMKWHSADACAERYEKKYDELFNIEDDK